MNLNSHTKNMYLVIGMTADLSSIKATFWNGLESWCSHINMVVAIQARVMPRDIPLKTCKYIHLTVDSDDVKQGVNRLVRIARARDHQRNRILSGVAHLPFESITMIDMDVNLPSWSAFMDAQAKLSTYDVVCANGYELHPRTKRRQVYDTFPLVLENGLWMYKHTTRNRQQTLFEDIMKHDMFPVRYCFGGMAVYASDIWKTPECNFRVRKTKFEAGRQSCEHLRFQNCLRTKRNLTNIGILSNLLLYRAWDPH